MKLNKTIREAFVNAALNDVPQIDYEQKIREAVLAEIVSQLPPKVKAIWDDPNLRAWIRTDWNSYQRVTLTHPSMSNNRYALSAAVEKQCFEWQEANRLQNAARVKLRENLLGAAESVTTRKALAALLPEFEKYLPAEGEQANRSVPAIANLVADFSKAGWPKDKASDQPTVA